MTCRNVDAQRIRYAHEPLGYAHARAVREPVSAPRSDRRSGHAPQTRRPGPHRDPPRPGRTVGGGGAGPRARRFRHPLGRARAVGALGGLGQLLLHGRRRRPAARRVRRARRRRRPAARRLRRARLRDGAAPERDGSGRHGRRRTRGRRGPAGRRGPRGGRDPGPGPHRDRRRGRPAPGRFPRDGPRARGAARTQATARDPGDEPGHACRPRQALRRRERTRPPTLRARRPPA